MTEDPNTLYPPKQIKLAEPSIFLAGPIQDTGDWQKKAIGILRILDKTVKIACPRRPEWNKSCNYNEQVDWETFHLEQAGTNGVIMFWLANQHGHNPDRAYAQTSRFELGEWKAKAEIAEVKIALGIEHGFSGKRYIMHRLKQDLPEIRVLHDLESTCKEALALLQGARSITVKV